MNHTARIIISLLALLIVSSNRVSADETTVSAPEAEVQRLTVVGGTAREQASVDWAISHFVDAGLELPNLVIEIHATDEGCDGYDGAFRIGRARVDVCNSHRLIILHELAHAWEHHVLTDVTRRDFMELRGLSAWNDVDTPWSERGIEDLAEVVVWGLRQLASDSAGFVDPEKEAAFESITGIDLDAGPDEEVTEARSPATYDRSEEDADWDTLR